MKTISDHIRKVREKPHHIRRRIAFGGAAIGAGIVAFVWLAGSLGTGAFALKDTSVADSTGGATVTTASADVANSQGLAGAAAATEDANAPAHIEIVDVATSTVVNKNAEQTTIPF